MTLETFGYFGAEPLSETKNDHYRSFGVNARALLGRLDVGVGWISGSDDLDVDIPASVLAAGFTGGVGQTRIIPGVIALIRPNVRAIAEVELYTHFEPADLQNLSRPTGLWLRLDVAF